MVDWLLYRVRTKEIKEIREVRNEATYRRYKLILFSSYDGYYYSLNVY